MSKVSNRAVKRLNKRERECLSVAVDILMKGSPAHRIVKYCIEEQKMNPQQICVMAEKMGAEPLLHDLAGTIKTICDLSKKGLNKDLYQYTGEWLREFLAK